MSGRRRKSESLRDRKEERVPQTELHSILHGDSSPKRSNSEANDALISGDFSGHQPSREPMQGTENIPTDIERDGNRMKMDPAFDEWENQYSSRPSDDSHALSYRAGDRGVGGPANMGRDRDRSRSRSWSPNQSWTRGRDRDRGGTRGRDRDRDRGRARSPFGDERQESYEYADIKNSSRLCKDFASGNCRRGSQCRFSHQELVDSRGGGNRPDNEYSGGSRHGDDRNSVDRPRNRVSDGYRKDEYCKDFMKGRCRKGASCGFPHHNASGDDYHRDNRTTHDDQDHRRQSTQSNKVPCKFFNMGKCNRNNCKFSHDAPESGGYGGSRDNILGHTSCNNNMPQDHASAWNGPSWNDMESGGFDKIQGGSQSQTLDARAQNVTPEVSGGQLANASLSVMPELPPIISGFQQHQLGDASVDMVIDNSDAHQQISSYGEDFGQTVHNMTSQFPSNLNGTQQNSHMIAVSSLNGPKTQLNGSGQDMFLHQDSQNLTEIQNKQETLKNNTPQLMNDLNATIESTKQVSEAPSLPVLLPPKLNIANALELLYALPISATSGAPVDSVESINPSTRTGILSNSQKQENHTSAEQLSSILTGDPNSKITAIGIPDTKQEPVGNLEGNEKRIVKNPKREQEKPNLGKSEAQGKVEDGNISNDEKAMRQFKISLVEFVKEILKPTWKEGKMSREVYKTIVKKVVDKVTSTIQGIQIPRTQEKIDQYLAFSKSKITKLVEAYVGRFLKA